ncbi:MAG: hypothetical protein WC700_17060 [Gemmatimonadaceae bacterium]
MIENPLPLTGPALTVVYLRLGDADDADNVPMVAMSERFTYGEGQSIYGERTWRSAGGKNLIHAGPWHAHVIEWTWGETPSPEEET